MHGDTHSYPLLWGVIGKEAPSSSVCIALLGAEGLEACMEVWVCVNVCGAYSQGVYDQTQLCARVWICLCILWHLLVGYVDGKMHSWPPCAALTVPIITTAFTTKCCSKHTNTHTPIRWMVARGASSPVLRMKGGKRRLCEMWRWRELTFDLAQLLHSVRCGVSWTYIQLNDYLNCS